MKKHKAIFELQNGGGSYLVKVEAKENGTEAQNKWGEYFNYLDGRVVFDNEAKAIARDMKKDGFVIKWK